MRLILAIRTRAVHENRACSHCVPDQLATLTMPRIICRIYPLLAKAYQTRHFTLSISLCRGIQYLSSILTSFLHDISQTRPATKVMAIKRPIHLRLGSVTLAGRRRQLQPHFHRHQHHYHTRLIHHIGVLRTTIPPCSRRKDRQTRSPHLQESSAKRRRLLILFFQAACFLTQPPHPLPQLPRPSLWMWPAPNWNRLPSVSICLPLILVIILLPAEKAPLSFHSYVHRI